MEEKEINKFIKNFNKFSNEEQLQFLNSLGENRFDNTNLIKNFNKFNKNIQDIIISVYINLFNNYSNNKATCHRIIKKSCRYDKNIMYNIINGLDFKILYFLKNRIPFINRLKTNDFFNEFINIIFNKYNDNDYIIYWYNKNDILNKNNLYIEEKLLLSKINEQNKSSSLIIINFLSTSYCKLTQYLINYETKKAFYFTCNKDKLCEAINLIENIITFDFFIECDKFFKIIKNRYRDFYYFYKTFYKIIIQNDDFHKKYNNQLKLNFAKKANLKFLQSQDFSFLKEEDKNILQSVIMLKKLKGE